MIPLDALAALAAGQWPQVTGTPELVMHRENTVFRVQTTTGLQALRLHRPGYHSAAALRSELDWMAMLAQAGMQVPIPTAARNGGFLVTLEGATPRMASLLSWLPGAPMGETKLPLAFEGASRQSLFHNLGRQMALMHQLADRWTLPDGFQRPVWDADGLVGENPVWGPFWLGKASGHDRVLLMRLREKAQKALADYHRQGADIGLIHADLVRENVLVEGSTLRFIDFDDCGFGFRLFDIATTLLKNIDEPDAPELEAALLAGYQSVRRIGAVDLAMLPLFIVLRALSYLGWAHARPDDPGIDARARRFLRIAKQAIATHMP